MTTTSSMQHLNPMHEHHRNAAVADPLKNEPIVMEQFIGLRPGVPAQNSAVPEVFFAKAVARA